MRTRALPVVELCLGITFWLAANPCLASPSGAGGLNAAPVWFSIPVGYGGILLSLYKNVTIVALLIGITLISTGRARGRVSRKLVMTVIAIACLTAAPYICDFAYQEFVLSKKRAAEKEYTQRLQEQMRLFDQSHTKGAPVRQQ